MGPLFHIVTDGLGALTPGDHVIFTSEARAQDGFSYRAILVWPAGVKPGTPLRSAGEHRPSPAYRSSLTIRWPDGTITNSIPDLGQGK